MKTRHILLLLVVAFLLSCARGIDQHDNGAQPARLASLPENPCEVIDAAQVSVVTGLEVSASRRVPDFEKIVRAQEENREPGPGTICNYETRGGFGSILIAVPARDDRSAAEYWKTRAKYFETFPGSAQSVPGLGIDAWISGGTALHVLVRGDEYFTLSTQMVQPRSREMLVNLAQAVLDKR